MEQGCSKFYAKLRRNTSKINDNTIEQLPVVTVVQFYFRLIRSSSLKIPTPE